MGVQEPGRLAGVGRGRRGEERQPLVGVGVEQGEKETLGGVVRAGVVQVEVVRAGVVRAGVEEPVRVEERGHGGARAYPIVRGSEASGAAAAGAPAGASPRSRKSRARASAQSDFTVRGETPSATAVSSTERPPK